MNNKEYNNYKQSVDNFFKKYPQMFVGKDQGLGSVPEGGFQTRIGKIGGTLGEGIDYGLDAAAIPFRALGKGVGGIFDYLTDKPQSTIDLEKQTALETYTLYKAMLYASSCGSITKADKIFKQVSRLCNYQGPCNTCS